MHAALFSLHAEKQVCGIFYCLCTWDVIGSGKKEMNSMKSDTRYPRIKRISVYDDEVSAYYLIARSGERVVIENRAAKEKKFILLLAERR